MSRHAPLMPNTEPMFLNRQALLSEYSNKKKIIQTTSTLGSESGTVCYMLKVNRYNMVSLDVLCLVHYFVQCHILCRFAAADVLIRSI